MLNVYIYKIEKTKPDIALPKQIIKHVNKYTDTVAKNNSLFAWTKAYELLQDYDFNFDHLSFNNKDEPVIKRSKIFFSISHSDKAAAIAISDCPVGVDIQKEIDIKKASFLANRVLNKTTFKKFQSSKSKSIFFTKEFCKIEALFKLNHFLKKNKITKTKFNIHKIKFAKQTYIICVANKNNNVININELEFVSK